jgi:hypothetical protein
MAYQIMMMLVDSLNQKLLDHLVVRELVMSNLFLFL